MHFSFFSIFHQRPFKPGHTSIFHSDDCHQIRLKIATLLGITNRKAIKSLLRQLQKPEILASKPEGCQPRAGRLSDRWGWLRIFPEYPLNIPSMFLILYPLDIYRRLIDGPFGRLSRQTLIRKLDSLLELFHQRLTGSCS